jgi:hypothetical protein
LNSKSIWTIELLIKGKKVLEINKSFTSVRNIILHGNNKPTSITIYPVSGGVAGIALDATEVEILRRNISNYKTAHQEVLDKMDEAIVIFGPDQKVSFYNSSFSSLCSSRYRVVKVQPDAW